MKRTAEAEQRRSPRLAAMSAKAAPPAFALEAAAAPPAKKKKKASKEAGGKRARDAEAPAADEHASAPPVELSAEAYRQQHAISGSDNLPAPTQSWADAPCAEGVGTLIRSLGWASPSAVQSQAWPLAAAGADLVAIAKTGSGKTLGFLLPAFARIAPELPLKPGSGPLALVLAPTRELAQQIHAEAERFGAPLQIKSAVVYGGAPKGPQIGTLQRFRPAVIVGTPGRLNDLLALNRPPVTNQVVALG